MSTLSSQSTSRPRLRPSHSRRKLPVVQRVPHGEAVGRDAEHQSQDRIQNGQGGAHSFVPHRYGGQVRCSTRHRLASAAKALRLTEDRRKQVSTASTKAIELRPDYEGAMAYLNLMYRDKADLKAMIQPHRPDLKTADEWVDKTMATRKAKAQESSEPTAPNLQ